MMCKADISEVNNSVHKIMILLSLLSPLKNSMLNTEFETQLSDAHAQSLYLDSFCMTQSASRKTALSIEGADRPSFTNLY
jgi:hypothetical protein